MTGNGRPGQTATAADVQAVLDDHPELSWLGYGGNGGDIAEGRRAQLPHPDSIAEETARQLERQLGRASP